MALLIFDYYFFTVVEHWGLITLAKGWFFIFLLKNIKLKIISVFFVTYIFKNKVLEEKRLNSKNNLINEKKTVSGVTKLSIR